MKHDDCAGYFIHPPGSDVLIWPKSGIIQGNQQDIVGGLLEVDCVAHFGCWWQFLAAKMNR
jgi:hypothetical protein